MILIGTHFCKACKRIRKKFPSVNYVCIPQRLTSQDSIEARAKRAVYYLKVSGFPVMVDDEMSKVLFYPR